MARSKCKVCDHPQLELINLALVMKTASPRDLEVSHPGYSREVFRKHLKYHLLTAERNKIYAREMARIDAQDTANARGIVETDKINVMASLAELSKECKKILKKVTDDNDNALALKAVGELRRQVELAARILGDLTDTQQTTIIVEGHPEWLKVRDTILGVLERHPQAKADFVRTIDGLHGQKRIAP